MWGVFSEMVFLKVYTVHILAHRSPIAKVKPRFTFLLRLEEDDAIREHEARQNHRTIC